MPLHRGTRIAAVDGGGLEEKLPSTVSGLVLWLSSHSADDRTESAGNVTALANKEGTANRDFSEATNPPDAISALGSTVPDFDGSVEILTGGTATDLNSMGINAGNTNMTMIILYRQDTHSTSSGNPWSSEGPIGDTGGYFGIGSDVTGPAVAVWQYGGATQKNLHTTSTGAWNLVTRWWDGVNLISELNQGDRQSVASALISSYTTDLRLGRQQGATSFMDGPVAEVIVYSNVLSDANRTLVENHVKNKWGV